MNAIMLCSGPSLAHYVPEAADLVCAINRAAILHPCHVWACGDWPLVEKIRDQVLTSPAGGLPLWYTAAGSNAHIRDHDPRGPWAGETIEFETLYTGHDRQHLWTRFTATAALWFLAHRGVKRLRVFGADWKGKEDFDGVDTGGTRNEARWSHEAEVWKVLADELRQKTGMVTERIQLEAAVR